MNYMKAIVWVLVFALTMSHAGFAGEVTYYHQDALGSTVAATDEQGNVLWREAYRPYGERILKQDGGSNKLWYTGKPHEEDMGLNYFGARWYDPMIGRFTGIDPVEFQEGNIHSFNRYAYANNNPYRYVDPNGESPILAEGILVAAAVGLLVYASLKAADQAGNADWSSLGLGPIRPANHPWYQNEDASDADSSPPVSGAEGPRPRRSSSQTEQWDKPGDVNDLFDDWESKGPFVSEDSTLTPKGDRIRIGTKEDGTTWVARPRGATEGFPSLDKQLPRPRSDGVTKIKTRYHE